MDTLSFVLYWFPAAYTLTFWTLAAAGGVYMFFSERKRKRCWAHTEAQDVAARYRSHYGEHALAAIGDHILAASFPRSREHSYFLSLVMEELVKEAVWPAQSVCSCFAPLAIEIADATPKRRDPSRNV